MLGVYAEAMAHSRLVSAMESEYSLPSEKPTFDKLPTDKAAGSRNT
jgi:hypothetical protein